jgi:hypothetical protein
MTINFVFKLVFQTWINMQSCCSTHIESRLCVAKLLLCLFVKWSDNRMHQIRRIPTPALVHIESVRARDMIVKKPHFRMKRYVDRQSLPRPARCSLLFVAARIPPPSQWMTYDKLCSPTTLILFRFGRPTVMSKDRHSLNHMMTFI